MKYKRLLLFCFFLACLFLLSCAKTTSPSETGGGLKPEPPIAEINNKATSIEESSVEESSVEESSVEESSVEESSVEESSVEENSVKGSEDLGSEIDQMFLFGTELTPVATCDGRFILRNNTGKLYSMVTASGTEILPLEYDRLIFKKAGNKWIVIAMHMGSCGVFDLQGNNLIPCEYSNIVPSKYDEQCQVTTFLGQSGVVDLKGNTVIPVEYDQIEFGYGMNIVAATLDKKDAKGKIDVFSVEGEYIKSFDWPEGGMVGVSSTTGGYYLLGTIQSGPTSFAITDIGSIYQNTIDCHTDEEKGFLFYVIDNYLVMRSVNSKEEQQLIHFNENAPDSIICDIEQSNIDPTTGLLYIDVSVLFYYRKADTIKFNYRFGIDRKGIVTEIWDTDSVMDENKLNWSSVGPSHNGKAMIVPHNSYIFTINEKGETVSELHNPYTEEPELIGCGAILKNNNSFSIIFMDGNPLLSKSGFSAVSRVYDFQDNFYIVTDKEGKQGLIDYYAYEIIPCGELVNIEDVLLLADKGEGYLESSYNPQDEFCLIIDNEKEALFDLKNHGLAGHYNDISKYGWVYDCIAGYDGYMLIDENKTELYIVSNHKSYSEIYNCTDLLTY